MSGYSDKDELRTAIRSTFAKYLTEFDDIPEELKGQRRKNCDRTPAENLSYQVGWTTLML